MGLFLHKNKPFALNGTSMDKYININKFLLIIYWFCCTLHNWFISCSLLIRPLVKQSCEIPGCLKIDCIRLSSCNSLLSNVGAGSPARLHMLCNTEQATTIFDTIFGSYCSTLWTSRHLNRPFKMPIVLSTLLRAVQCNLL